VAFHPGVQLVELEREWVQSNKIFYQYRDPLVKLALNTEFQPTMQNHTSVLLNINLLKKS